MRRTLFSLGNLVDQVKPNETSYRVDIGEDMDDLKSMNLAVATVLLTCADQVYEVSKFETQLVVRCLNKLDPERLQLLRDEVEASGWTLTLASAAVPPPLAQGLQMFSRPLFA